MTRLLAVAGRQSPVARRPSPVASRQSRYAQIPRSVNPVRRHALVSFEMAVVRRDVTSVNGCTWREFPSGKSAANAAVWPFERSIGGAITTQRTPSVYGNSRRWRTGEGRRLKAETIGRPNLAAASVSQRPADVPPSPVARPRCSKNETPPSHCGPFLYPAPHRALGDTRRSGKSQ